MTRPVRQATLVAHVLRKLDPAAWGGTEAHLAAIGARLRGLGIEGEVHAPVLEGTDTRGADRAVGLPVRRYQAFCPFVGPAEARRALVQNAGNVASLDLVRAMGRSEAQLAHLHTAGRIGGAVRTAMRWTGRPYVVSLHGPVLTAPEFLGPQVERLLAPVVDLGRPLGWALGARRVLDDAARVIAFNDAEVVALQGRIGGRAVRLDHGVDATRLGSGDVARARARWPELGDARVVLVLGRLCAQKDQVLAVRAFARGAPKDNLLVLAGAETDPGYRARIEEEAARLGVRERVRLLGNVPPEHVPDLLARARVVLAPSRHEAFGLMALEAWAAGRPILFARRHGLADVADRFERWAGPGARELGARFTVRGESEAAWAPALAGLLADEDTRHEIGARGRALVATRFTWARASEALAEVYDDVLAERRGRATVRVAS